MRLINSVILILLIGFSSAFEKRFLGLSSLATDIAEAARKQLLGHKPRIISNNTELLVAEPYALSRIDVNASTRFNLVRTQYVGGLDYHLGRDLIYWSELSTGRVYSRLLNAQGREVFQVELVIDRSPAVWRPKAIAVDYLADKLYVLDSRGYKVHVFELDGRQRSVIFDGYLSEPMDIAVDPHEGLMFIADGTRIIRVNMDGSSPQAIVGHRKYRIKSVSLDLKNKRVYWSDETYHRIKSANYDGSDFVVVLKNEFGKPYSLLGPANLAYHENRLYFYDDMYRRLASVDIDSARAVPDESTYKIVYDMINVQAVKVIDKSRKPSQSNPCAQNNGGCQQMCLIGAKSLADGALKHSCACHAGFILADDFKSCL